MGTGARLTAASQLVELIHGLHAGAIVVHALKLLDPFARRWSDEATGPGKVALGSTGSPISHLQLPFVSQGAIWFQT